jgi:hypothetical protein
MLEAFGEKWRDFFFFPKESRGQKFIFRGFPHRGVFSLSNLEFLRRQFSTWKRSKKRHVEKRGKTPVLPKKEASMKPTEASF